VPAKSKVSTKKAKDPCAELKRKLKERDALLKESNAQLKKRDAELKERNAEVTETLEQQTATAEILKVISSSPTDTQPVFEAIIDNALRLCDAPSGGLQLYDGERLDFVAIRGRRPEFIKWFAENPSTPASSSSPRTRMIAEQQPIHILDRRESPGYREGNPLAVALVDLDGIRTALLVPLLKEGRLVGAIIVNRREVRAFTQKQIDLISTFASQAVIAIENVRLFNETKEALQQQTVISEILRVISSSPTDTQPVFDAIVNSGLHLFGGMDVSLRLVKGEQLETVAHTRPTFDTSNPLRTPLEDESMPASRAILRREVVQIPDYLSPEEWVSPKFNQIAERFGFRALVSAPILRENKAIGTINVTRATLGLFTEKQIELLKTFADQAVIAIENVRGRSA